MKLSSLSRKKQPIPSSRMQGSPSPSNASQDPNFNFEAWFATPEMVAEPQKMMLEIIIYWKGGIIDICHYNTPKRITFGNDPRADFCYPLDDLPLPHNQTLFSLIEPGGQGFVLGFYTEMEGTVEHNGERFTFRELVKEGRAHYFARSGCCYYPLAPGVQVQMDLNGLELAIQFVPVPPIQVSRIRQLGIQAPVLSFSVIAHLLFVLFAVASGTSAKKQPQSPPQPPQQKKLSSASAPLYLEPIYFHPRPSSKAQLRKKCTLRKKEKRSSHPPKSPPLHKNCTP